MTLRKKNLLTFILSIFFLGISIFFLIYFLLKINLILNDEDFFNAGLSLKDFNKNFWAATFSGICLLIYIPITGFYIYSHFIKTPATEVIYFMFFLLGCATVLTRFFVLFEALPNTFPQFHILLGHIIFGGRTLCFASLFASAIVGTPEHRVNVEQYIFMVIVFSLMLTNFVPVNTANIEKITTSFTIETGMNFFIIFFYCTAALLTFVGHAIRAWQNENKNYLFLGIYIFFIEGSIIVLSSSKRLTLSILSFAVLAVCTFQYLTCVHKQYV